MANSDRKKRGRPSRLDFPNDLHDDIPPEVERQIEVLNQDLHERIKFVAMTPIMAKDLLRGKVTIRKESGTDIKKYENIMKSGEWKPDNGETIKLDHAGRLIDGQHRLFALINLNRTMPMLLHKALEEDDEIPDTVDFGKRRTLNNLIQRHFPDTPYPQITTGAIKYLYHLLVDKNIKKGKSIADVSETTYRKFYEQRRSAINEAVRKAASINSKAPNVNALSGFVEPAVLAAVYYVADQTDSAKCKEFFSILALREGSSSDLGYEFGRLRDKGETLKKKTSRQKEEPYKTVEKYAFLLHLWTEWYNERPIGQKGIEAWRVYLKTSIMLPTLPEFEENLEGTFNKEEKEETLQV